MRPWTAQSARVQVAELLRLQWGHGLAAVDGCTCIPSHACAPRASMGPRPCGRGRRRCRRRRGGHVPASMGPRPCGRGRPCRRSGFGRSGCCFNGATALRPWTASPRPCTRSFPLRFNGATALRPWTADVGEQFFADGSVLQWGHGLAAVDGAARPRHARRRPASMGPRPCGRGRLGDGRRRRGAGQLQWGHGLAAVDGRQRKRDGPPLPRFNGATALRPWTDFVIDVPTPMAIGLQWGHGLAAVDGLGRAPLSHSATCFNGATALRPWTAGNDARAHAPAATLQWGHGLAAVDGDRHRKRGGCRRQLQWGHGLAAVDGRCAAPPSCSIRGFNGATALRPWTVKISTA